MPIMSFDCWKKPDYPKGPRMGSTCKLAPHTVGLAFEPLAPRGTSRKLHQRVTSPQNAMYSS